MLRSVAAVSRARRDQGVAETIGADGPGSAVIVVNVRGEVSEGVPQLDGLAIVVEGALVDAEVRCRRVGCGEGGCVGGEHEARPARKNSLLGKGEGDACAEEEAGEVQRGVAKVGQLDEIVGAATGGMVHELRDGETRPGGRYGEIGRVEGAPGFARARPRPHGRIFRDTNRFVIVGRGSRELTGSVHSRVAGYG